MTLALQTDKSCICKITSEMLKAGGNNIIRWLTHIINDVWHSKNLPEDWTRGIILPFWKKKGDKLVCSNNRGITLLSIPGKFFTRVLLSRSLPAIRCYRRPQQADFMPNRSMIDQISALRPITEKTREFRKGRHLYIAFIDLKAAFDSADHASLWAILACIGVPGKILRLCKKLYGDSQSCVHMNGKLSEWFNINSGVRQGCVAAPALFNCVVDHLMSRVCAQIPAVSFGNLHPADLEYADDTVLLSNGIEKFTTALSVYDRESRKLGLKVSWAKTKLTHVGEGSDSPSLNIDGNAVEFADLFVYLGSTVTNNGDLKPEIERRRAPSSNVMQALRKQLWHQQSISRTTKMRIYNAAVLSVLLYGAETWPLTGTLSSRLA